MCTCPKTVTVMMLSLVALITHHPSASAEDLGDYGVRLFDGANYQQPGPRLNLAPHTQLFLNEANTIGGDWSNRVSSIQLGTKAGVVLQGPEFYYVYTSDAQSLGELNDKAYAITVFDRTTQKMPDGAGFLKYHDGYVTGSSLTRYSWFIPARKTAQPQVNQWPGSLLDNQDLRYLQVYGANTRVVVSPKTGSQKEYKAAATAYNLDGDIPLGNIDSIEVLTTELTRSPGDPGLNQPGVPGVPVPPATPSPSDLSGIWHSNLGNFYATQQGSTLTGEMIDINDANVRFQVVGTIQQNKVTFAWTKHPFNFEIAKGELTVSTDLKSMDGTYSSNLTGTNPRPWNLWR